MSKLPRHYAILVLIHHIQVSHHSGKNIQWSFLCALKRVVSPPAALQVPTHIEETLFQSQPPGLLGVYAQLGGKEGPKAVCGELGHVFAHLDWSSSYTKDGSAIFFLGAKFHTGAKNLWKNQ